MNKSNNGANLGFESQLWAAADKLRGADRAKYGEKLLALLSKELRKHHINSTGRRQLYNYLSFYRVFPEIVRTVPAQSKYLFPTVIVSVFLVPMLRVGTYN